VFPTDGGADARIQACAQAQMAGFLQAPKELRKNMEDHANTFNTPRVGSHENYAFTAMQLNIAPAVAEDTSESVPRIPAWLRSG
jgi:hypothetical protein